MQRIFDVNNEQDVKDLFKHLIIDVIYRQKKEYTNTLRVEEHSFYRTGVFGCKNILPININWQDKTEITRPVEKIYELDSNICVNSNWRASWTSGEDQECCQCGFECKIKIRHIKNDYMYIVSKKEYEEIKEKGLI